MRMLGSLLMSSIGFVPPLIVLAGCVILWRRLRDEDALLMLVGTSANLVLRFVQVVLSALITPKTSVDLLMAVNYGTLIASVIASLLFAFGLLRLARSVTRDLSAVTGEAP